MRRRGWLPQVPGDNHHLRFRDLPVQRLHGTVDVQCIRSVHQANGEHVFPLHLQRHKMFHGLLDERGMPDAQRLRHEQHDQQLRSEAASPGVLGRQRMHDRALLPRCLLQQRLQHRLSGLQPCGNNGQLHQRGQRSGSARLVLCASRIDLWDDRAVRGGTVRALGIRHSVHRRQLPDGLDAHATVDVQRHRDVCDSRDNGLRAWTLRRDDVDLPQHVHDGFPVHGARDLQRRWIVRAQARGWHMHRHQRVRRGPDLLPDRGQPWRVLQHRVHGNLRVLPAGWHGRDLLAGRGGGVGSRSCFRLRGGG